MSFVTPALLAGTLLVGLPIILHLVMRREPVHLVFPALQFVRKRRASNQTRLRLRHWLLLALRCLVIAGLAMALARPSLHGDQGGAGKDAPIAAALVVDNSLRMQYQHANQSRLEAAAELGTWLVQQLPADSPLAVADRAARRIAWTPDKSAAEMKLSRMAPSGAVRPLHEVIQEAANLLAEREDHRAEIYAFTDLAAVTWSDDALSALQNTLKTHPELTLYLVDVGVADPHNAGLDGLRLSQQTPTVGSSVEIETTIRTTSPADEEEKGANYAVELYLRGADGTDVKRGEKLVVVDTDGSAPVSFSLPGFERGTHQGYVRLVRDDALPCDNTQYFTIDVRPPRRVALVARREQDVLFLRQALAPEAALAPENVRYHTEFFPTDNATGVAFGEFDAVCLLDPPPLAESVWQELVDYVGDGGGLGVFLGRHAEGQLDRFNSGAAQNLLPGKLRWQSRDATFLRPLVVDHPILASLSDYANEIPWPAFPVWKYWQLDPHESAAYVVVSYDNGDPAIVERQVGRGHVLTMTTPVSDAANQDPWNLLPTGPNPWPFLALATGVVDYLAGAEDNRLNYQAGEAAVVRLAPHEQVSSYVLQTPGGDALRQTLVVGQREIVVAATETVGNYRLLAGGQRGRLDRGFSVNVPPDTSRVDRAEFGDIQQALGQNRVFLATNTEEIELRVGLGRVGRELFPWLICAVVLVLGTEQLLSNRFYREQP